MSAPTSRGNEPVTQLRRARVGYAVIAVALLVGCLVVASLRPASMGASALAGVAAIGLGLVVLRPRRRVAWLLIAATIVLLGTSIVALRPQTVDAAGIGRYLAAYVTLSVGLLVLGHQRGAWWRWPPILDLLTISLAGSLLGWVILRSEVAGTHPTGLGMGATVAAWVGYNVVLAATARILVTFRVDRAIGLLAAAIAAFLIAALPYDHELITHSDTIGVAVAFGFVSFNILCGAAALHASGGVVATTSPARHGVGPVRLVLLSVAVMVAPTVLLVQVVSGLVTTGIAVAVVSAEVGLVMVLRLYLVAKAYGRRVRGAEAVGRASRALVVASTEDETIAAVKAAPRELLPADVPGDVRLSPSPARSASETAAVSTSDPPGTVDELAFPLTADANHAVGSARAARTRPPARALVYTAPAARLADLSPALQILTDQAALALHRIDLSHDLRAKERERYFHTLVLTSDDVTLISRDGAVVYATPSALSMFGRDVTGQRLGDLVQRTTDEVAEHAVGWAEAEGRLRRDGEELVVLIRSRDLSRDPTIGGIVTTLRDVTVERRLQRDLVWRATHDPLTGLANTQHFGEQLQNGEVRGRHRAGPGKAAFYIDLDDFKAVNDRYGHHIGDRLLIETARRIQSCLRDNDMAARLGGDEFAALLRDLADVQAACDVARRMTEALNTPVTVESLCLTCAASIGIAYTESVSTGDSLLREADIALYAAKARGKGVWMRYGVDHVQT